MHLWRDMGSPHSSFFGTTLLKIDTDLPDARPEFASANFPGYLSVLRQGGNTPLETAVWFVNGNHYWDHSHADQGEVVIYALGAPLSLDWGSTYEPRVDSAFMHSLALSERVFGRKWDADAPPVQEESRWGTFAGTKTSQTQFSARPQGGVVAARMTAPDGVFTWTRTVALDRLRQDLPVILIRDRYEGPEAQAPKVFTLNLVADGGVEIPGGKVTPQSRIRGYERNHSERQEMPSAGKAFDLPAGVNRLGFTGQPWKVHPDRGIDFDVYVVANEPRQGLVGNWAHAWHPAGAMDEFERTNGRPFEERQHILRLRGSGGFTVVVVPRRKGAARPDVRVREENGATVVSNGAESVTFPPQ